MSYITAYQEPKCEITRGERDVRCHCMTCQEFRDAAKLAKGQKRLQLYCIAYETHQPKTCQACLTRRGIHTWVPDMEYTHAEDISAARLTFYHSQMDGVMRETRTVGVSEVVGYFVEDNKGNNLSV